jgi:tetratricopeptide (TPR) repeat protein
VIGMVALPLDLRFTNAIASVWRYLEKTFWPVNLAVFYPHSAIQLGSAAQWSDWQVVLGIVGMVLISVLVFRLRGRMPWLLVGWCWYLITLLPVIGIIQVGVQSMADRYTYIPLIGVFVGLVWTVADLFKSRREGIALLTTTGVLIIVACALVTRRQVGYWRNDLTLFGHALEVTSGSAVAHSIFAQELAAEGKYDLAKEHFQTALKADPNYIDGQYNFVLVLEKHAFALAKQGQIEDAVREYEAALEVRPTASVHDSLGALLSQLGRYDEALNHYNEALQLDPNLLDVRYNMGIAFALSGKIDEATEQFAEVIRRDPARLDAREKLATLLAQKGKLDEAALQFEEMLRAHPDAATWYKLGLIHAMQQKPAAAAADYRHAIELNPDLTLAFNDLAWLRATANNPDLRDGKEAVQLAERACGLTDFREPLFIGTLAAAYAEAGRFDDAVKTAEKAIASGTAAGNKEVVGKNNQLLELYRAGKPYHEPLVR